MNLVFSGLEGPVRIEPGCVSVLQVENEALFTRIAASLRKGAGADSPEPYSVWDGEREVRPNGWCLFVSDPLNLPWGDQRLLGRAVARMEREFLEDEDMRREVEGAQEAIAAAIMRLTFGMESPYDFRADWDFKKYLKMLGFAAMPRPSGPYVDELIDFLGFMLDIGNDMVLTFVNLKTFLTKNELECFYEHVFYAKLSVLLLENKTDMLMHEHEEKKVVDLDFLEH